MKFVHSETRLVVVEAKELEVLKEQNERLRAEIETLRQTIPSGTSRIGLLKRAKKNAKAFWKTITRKVVKKETNGWETCGEATWTVTSTGWDNSVGQPWDDTTTDQSQATTVFKWPDVKISQESQGIQRNGQEETDSSLEVESRLNDASFYDTPASRCTIPAKVQQAIMGKTIRQSQATVYRALGTRCPDIQRCHYYDGPQIVRFGFGELKPIFDSPIPGLSNLIVEHMFDVIDLRNAISHFSPQKTRDIDILLQRAQALAVVLADARAAFKIRALRDELQKAALKTYEDIKAGVGVAALPFSRPWAPHIQRLFDDMTFTDSADIGHNSLYPLEVARAANDWKHLYTSPGELDPEYEAKVAKAKKTSSTDLRSHDTYDALANNYNTATDSNSDTETEQPCPGPVLDVRLRVTDAEWTPETVLGTEKRKRAIEDDDDDDDDDDDETGVF